MKKSIAAVSVVAAASAAVAQSAWAPTDAGPWKVTNTGSEWLAKNGAAELKLSLKTAHPLDFKNLWSGESWINLGDPFTLVFDSDTVHEEDVQWTGTPTLKRMKGNGKAPCMAHRKGGWMLEQKGTVAQHPVSITRRWIFIDTSHSVRQEITLSATSEVMLKEFRGWSVRSTEALVRGTVPGSPATHGTFFFGMDSPMAEWDRTDGKYAVLQSRKTPMAANAPVTFTTSLGVAPIGQLRRAFVTDIELFRAHPYRPFLHYNSWYDIGYFTPYTETEAVQRISEWKKLLVDDRKVKIDNFLFDDGWDNTGTCWEFSKDFPGGFKPVSAAAEKAGGQAGIWLSPWGGYGRPREQRLATGKKLGYEIDSQGYALSGPKYYDRFREVCLDMVKNQGIGHFKFDGTGSPDKQVPGSRFDSDFAAAIELIGDLRKARPGLFVNVTTGTWPSPYWLEIADSIWRNGSDHGFDGVGSDRQKWITYRDGATYSGVVKKAPFYPLNSLMLHGLIFAQHAHNLEKATDKDFRDEVRTYFGNGTQLQEMYITPSLLSPTQADILAEGANWSRSRADVLVDSHWVGGDPAQLEVYGWASFTGKNGILVLRNPSDKPQAMYVDLGAIFELPQGFNKKFTLKSPYPSDDWRGPTEWDPTEGKVMLLEPFEVKVMEATAR
ncbi:MAG: enterotoxin [Armatimonadetes bacterium]|nr:enterotoxin [Armatimonadota bacterium]